MSFPYPLFPSSLNSLASSTLPCFFLVHLRHLHESGKDLGRLVVTCSVNLCDHLPMVHIPEQQRGIHQQPLCGQRAHKFFSISTVSASSKKVIKHTFQYSFDRYLCCKRRDTSPQTLGTRLSPISRSWSLAQGSWWCQGNGSPKWTRTWFCSPFFATWLCQLCQQGGLQSDFWSDPDCNCQNWTQWQEPGWTIPWFLVTSLLEASPHLLA